MAAPSACSSPDRKEAARTEGSALKRCVCSAGGLEATEAGDQILFMVPSLAGSFQAGLKKRWRALAFDLGAASAGSPDLFLTRGRDEERHEETTNRGQRRKDW